MSTDDPARSQIDENWGDPSSELFPDLPVKPRASLPVASRTKSVPPPPPSAARVGAPLAAALIGPIGPNRKRSVPPPPPRARGADTADTLSLFNATPADEKLELAQTAPGLGPLSVLVSPQELDAEASASDAVTVPLPEAAPGPYALPSLFGPPVLPLDPSPAPAKRAVADSSERIKTDDTEPIPESGAHKLETFDEELDDFGPEDFDDIKPRVVAETYVRAEADDENLITRAMAAAPLLDAASADSEEPTGVPAVSGFKSGRTHSLPPLVAPRKPLAPPAPRASAAPALGSLPLPSILPPPSLPPLPPLPPLPSVPTPARFAGISFAGSSLAPVALARGVALARSLFPLVGQKRRVATLSALGLGGLALCTTLLMLIFGSDANAGALVVTVSGAGNAPVSSLAVLADDAVSCRTSPCKIADLDPGTHFVRVRAPGYQETAARAVSVQKGSEAVVHIQLTPAGKEPRAADEASVATRTVTNRDDPTAQAAPADLEQERSSSRTPRQSARVLASAATGPRSAEAQPDKAVKSGKPGTLNISSTPASNVVLDGRPLGKTPRLGVRVAAGVHSVVFVHPQFGRKVQSASVAPGAARSVAVRFR